MSYPRKRVSIRIILTPRSAEDPDAVLRAVERNFRPDELEIRVTNKDHDSEMVVNEVLEIEAKRCANECLDRKDAEVRGGGEAAAGGDAKKTEKKVRSWLRKWGKAGWIVVRAVIQYAAK